MAGIKEKLNNTWKAITFPDGINKAYDDKCDDAFLNFFDKIITVCYSFFFVFATISIYFFITRELL